MKKNVILTPMFRVSFPSVFKAKRNDLNGKDEYSVVALFPPGADLNALKQAAASACIEKWGPDQTKWPANLKSPFRKNEDKMKDGVLPDGMPAGGFFMTLRSTQRPGIVDQNKQEIIDPSGFYAGCYARAAVSVYAYDQKGNRGVSFGLTHLQFMKDGDPFSGRPRVEDAFTPIEGMGADGDAGSVFG